MRFWLSMAILGAAAFGLALSPANEYFFYAAFVVLTSSCSLRRGTSWAAMPGT